MSYCRWSDLDFGCDLYCYESSDGFVTHVASSRPAGEVPHLPPDWFRRDDRDWAQVMRERSEFLRTCAYRDIGLPHDGATFVDVDAAAMLDRVSCLGGLGYRFPPHVIAMLAEEDAEAQGSSAPR